jgi:hypothetical protein
MWGLQLHSEQYYIKGVNWNDLLISEHSIDLEKKRSNQKREKQFRIFITILDSIFRKRNLYVMIDGFYFKYSEENVTRQCA